MWDMKEMNKATDSDLAHLPRVAVLCEKTRGRDV